ncbi:leucyl aminopeptidase family protein [Polyangium sp. 6x1]|uniref:M17 family metallopeptidase n=1 Tax=Polyangium sp. 6x1 TaxID=3042689 RepID=UPI00248226B1|nr:leucyl aminopeptidase family protein [Polyangium sp. 6x1]MDI1445605.1 leucyl aminopeptidase family protein [Polyangium sp. 6x1]
MSSYDPPLLLGQPEEALAQSSLEGLPFDALVLVAPSPISTRATLTGPVAAALACALKADAGLDRGPRPPAVIAAPALPGGRLVVVPMGPLGEDTDDVRSVAEAVAAGTSRAVDAGATRPLVWVQAPSGPRFARAREVAALAALGSQWAPVEAREAGKAPRTAEAVGMVGLDEARARSLSAIDHGRALCRDIAGTEPERMAPRRIAELCEIAFRGTGVEVEVEHDVSGYPLLAAVARASMGVERHRPCVVRLSYTPEAPASRTLVLVGKGVTYDTGGADLKTDGHMAGMSRDKGGAGAVAGLVLAASLLKVPVRVVGLLGLVRNSVGDESFVSDEIIRARSGVRVRIGNTDAEGRLVLADLLAEAKTIAERAPSPTLFSVATLTGHVYRAFGPYVGAIGNGPAQRAGTLELLDRLGEAWGEPVERSRPRREDYSFVAPRSSAEDVVSSNRLASVNTPRGHQFPFAFLDIASGLRGERIPFVHLDIGGVVVDPPDWQFGRPTGSPVAMLTALLGQPTE